MSKLQELTHILFTRNGRTTAYRLNANGKLATPLGSPVRAKPSAPSARQPAVRKAEKPAADPQDFFPQITPQSSAPTPILSPEDQFPELFPLEPLDPLFGIELLRDTTLIDPGSPFPRWEYSLAPDGSPLADPHFWQLSDDFQ
jgi:hypothetical protein